MSISNLPLMKAIGAKVDYLDRRQQVIAQNMANADTPGYQSKDLTKVDFGAVLKNVTSANHVSLAKTNPGHISTSDVASAREKKDKLTYEVAPDANGVILEEQAVKASQIRMDYNLMLNISAKQSAMYRTALGLQG